MKVLVVWYSRSGNTTKAAREIIRALEDQGEVTVESQELKEIETKRDGVLGWLKSGRDAMRKREADIRPVLFDVSEFDLVVIGTPVWAFTVTPAVRKFCREHGPRCARVAFFCTMGGKGHERTFREMAELCGKQPVGTLALVDTDVNDRDQHKLTRLAEGFARQCVRG